MRWLTAHAVCSTALRSVERARLRCLRRVQTPPPPELLSPFDPSLRMTPQLLRSALSSPLGRSSTTTRQVDKLVAPLARAAGARTGPGRCAALAPSAFSRCVRATPPFYALLRRRRSLTSHLTNPPCTALRARRRARRRLVPPRRPRAHLRRARCSLLLAAPPPFCLLSSSLSPPYAQAGPAPHEGMARRRRHGRRWRW